MKNIKGSTTGAVILTVLITAVVLSAGFYVWYQYFSGEGDYNVVKIDETEDMEEPTDAEEPEEELPEPVSNMFNFNTVQVGDQVGNMTVESMKPFEPDFSGLAFDNLAIEFSGEEIITGKYRYSPIGMLAEITCFSNLDAESLDKVPQMENDEITFGFCFSNQEEAMEKLGISGDVDEVSTATIKIKDYILVRYPSAVYSMAELVEVIAKE